MEKNELEKEKLESLKERLSGEIGRYFFLPASSVVEIAEEAGVHPVRVKTWTDGEGIYKNSRYSEEIQFGKDEGRPLHSIQTRVLKDSSSNEYAELVGHCDNYFNVLLEFQCSSELPPAVEVFRDGVKKLKIIRYLKYTPASSDFHVYTDIPSARLMYHFNTSGDEIYAVSCCAENLWRAEEERLFKEKEKEREILILCKTDFAEGKTQEEVRETILSSFHSLPLGGEVNVLELFFQRRHNPEKMSI